MAHYLYFNLYILAISCYHIGDIWCVV